MLLRWRRAFGRLFVVASFGDSSAIPETEPIGWHAGHLVNGKLQCEHVRLAHVPAEDPWVSAVRAWMWLAFTGNDQLPIGGIIVCGWRIRLKRLSARQPRTPQSWSGAKAVMV
jgi:hypothetical protein